MPAIADRVRSAPAPVDFAATSIVGQVDMVREMATGFYRINLADRRVVVGEFSEKEIIPSVSYQFVGTWGTHERHGTQFRAEAAVLATQTELGVISYLHRSGLGLTHADARKLWKHYGVAAIDTLRNQPDRIRADGHMDNARADKASALLASQGADEATVLALHALFAGRGIPKGAIADCVREWGPKAPAVIRRDPFKLITTDIEGVGFKRADQLYLDLGFPMHRLKRQMLAAWHYLTRSGTGHTWESIGNVNRAIVTAAGGIMAARLAEAVTLGVRAKWLARRIENGVEVIAHKGAAESEQRLAKHVRRIMTHAARWPNVDGLAVSDHQRDNIRSILGSAIAILGGTPGTGKTYVAAALLKLLVQTIGPGAICVCAPTGKAAVRITDALSRYGLPIQARTIHSILGPDGTDSFGRWKFVLGESKPHGASVYVADEASMIDTDIAAALFAAIPPGGNVLLVGDVNQLPPVGHGAPLRDLIAAGIPTATLTELQRNSGAIVAACAEIRDGRMFDAPTTTDVDAGLNLRLIDLADAEQQMATLLDVLRRSRQLGFDPVWDTQVVVGTNDKGELSRKSLNTRLQSLLNPTDHAIAAAGVRTGDKVICLKNRPGVPLANHTGGKEAEVNHYSPTGEVTYLSNGDQGRIMATDKRFLIVRFTGPDRMVRLPRSKKAEGASAADIDLAYAITVHKSQGSEWPFVIVCLDGTGGVGCREWIYTAISRAKRLCFAIGPRAAAVAMIGRREVAKRKTYLVEQIRSATTEQHG